MERIKIRTQSLLTLMVAQPLADLSANETKRACGLPSRPRLTRRPNRPDTYQRLPISRNLSIANSSRSTTFGSLADLSQHHKIGPLVARSGHWHRQRRGCCQRRPRERPSRWRKGKPSANFARTALERLQFLRFGGWLFPQLIRQPQPVFAKDAADIGLWISGLHHILCEPRQVLWFDLIDWSGVVYGIPRIGAVVLIVVDVIERETDMLRTDEFRNVVYVPQ